VCKPRPGARCGDNARPAPWVAKRRGMTADAVLRERAERDVNPNDKPAAPRKSMGSPADRAVAAIKSLAAAEGHAYEWVSITKLRGRLSGMSRAEQDALLIQLDRRGDVYLAPLTAQSQLTPADRAAALMLGGKAQHQIRMSS
jgi:hypothetical protein